MAVAVLSTLDDPPQEGVILDLEIRASGLLSQGALLTDGFDGFVMRVCAIFLGAVGVGRNIRASHSLRQMSNSDETLIKCLSWMC